MRINEITDTNTNMDDNHAENSVKDTLKYILETKFVQENCQPFFKAIGGMKNYLDNPSIRLYHGTHKSMDTPQIFDIPKNRKPRDTPIEIHDALVKCFKELGFSATRENSVFMTANRGQAGIYGQPHYIIPVGEFGFTWSPYIQDLYSPVTFAEMLGGGVIAIEPDDYWKEFYETYLVGSTYAEDEDGNTLDPTDALQKLIYSDDEEVHGFFETYLSYAKQLHYHTNDFYMKDFISSNYLKDEFLEAIDSKKEIAVNCEKVILIPLFYK